MEVLEAMRGRRSLRQLSDRPVPRELLDQAIEMATLAPAPHHTRPWRYVILRADSRARLAERMGAAWRADLERDGHPENTIARLLRRSKRQIVSAPTLVLSCLTHEGLRNWPDERRSRHEWAMAQQSAGAGLQNLMLAAHALGLASYWISAPLFAPEAVADALALPDGWVAQALIVIGFPAEGAAPGSRPAVDVKALVSER